MALNPKKPAKPNLLNKLPPEKRQKALIILAAGGAFAVISLMVVLASDAPTKRGGSGKTDAMGNVLMTGPAREMGLDGVARDMDRLEREMNQLRAENERLRGGQGAPAGPAPRPADPDAALAQLSGEVERTRTQGPPGTLYNPGRANLEPVLPQDTGIIRPTGPGQSGGAAGGAQYGRGSANANANQAPAPMVAPQIQTIRAEAPSAAAAAVPAAPKRPPVYLPTGSMVTGTLLTGLDAPTGRAAQNAPIPVVIRVQHEAILPSRYRSDVREAFILASGYGDLSSERAYLRAERISMILKNGDVIDIPARMAAVGSDGKSGLRGRLVSKQGAIIAKALLAGTADGISRAFSSNYSVGGSGEDQSAGDVGIAGLSGGASTALDRVAAYFLAQAESQYPVIEIDGGREITMILLEGIELRVRGDEPGNATASTSTRTTPSTRPAS